MDQDGTMTLSFRCPPEYAGVLPPPVPAVQGLPGWFKSLPQKAFNATTQSEGQTVKRCPPFIDAMTYGFLIPLPCDVKVENGEFTWDLNLPTDRIDNFARSPIAFHDPSQVAGTPFFREDSFAIKFNCFWSIEAPPGYSVLFTHPVNRPDLPFTTLTGLVDCDLYHDSRVNFPADWHDMDFSGVLPKGTPIVQCIPFKRDSWRLDVGTQSDEELEKVRAMGQAIARENDVYREKFRAAKR